MIENLWIKVDDGKTFEGNLLHWADVFFSNPTVESIVDFCLNMGSKVEFSQTSEDNHVED